MKKSIKYTTAAALALSAVTPVAAFAAESEASATVEQGLYTVNGFISIDQFVGLSNTEKLRYLSDEKSVLVIDGLGAIYSSVVVTGTDEELENGYKTVEKFVADNNIVLDPEKGVIVPDEQLAVKSVSAINLTTVTVEFSEALESLEKSAVSITNNKTTAKQTIKSVTLSEDKKSAEVVLYNPLAASTTYGVSVVVGESTLTGEVAIGDLVPATIEAETTQTVRANEATAVEYKVFDADGIDITKSLGSDYAVAFTSNAVNSAGKVTLASGTQTSTKVQVKKGTAVVAESETITLVAADTELSKISHWTIGEDKVFAGKDYKQVTSLEEGETATVGIQVLDQFEKVASGYTVQYTSLDTSVGIVDKTTGKITTVAQGELPIQINVLQGDKVVLTETVVVDVTDVAEFEALTLDKSEVAISKLDTVGTKVTATLVDQFGNPWVAQDKDVEIVSNDNVDVSAKAKPNATTGKVEFTIDAASGAEAGTYTLDVKYGTEKVGTLTVVVEEAGVFAGYDVRGLETELDLNTAETNKKKDMTITAVPVDADGKAVGDAVNPTLVVTEKGKTAAIETAVESNKVVKTGLEKGKEYEVTVTVSGVVVKKHTFKVVDSTPATVVEFTSTTLADAVKGSESLLTAINNVLVVDGKTVAEGASAATAVEFTTGDSAVINNNGIVFADSAATTIYVTKITLANGKEVKFSNVPLTIKTTNELTKLEGEPVLSQDSLTNVTAAGAKFITEAIKDENGVQTPATLAQVKAAIESKYGVTFNITGITVTDGKLAIDNTKPILTTADWNKIKATGDIAVPYRITLVEDASKTKKAKIAIFEDGIATIETP